MSNHCIDLICLNCGAEWCCRGCGDRSESSKENLERYLKQSQELADKYHNGIVRHCVQTDRCSFCNNSEGKVVIK